MFQCAAQYARNSIQAKLSLSTPPHPSPLTPPCGQGGAGWCLFVNQYLSYLVVVVIADEHHIYSCWRWTDVNLSLIAS